jgi:hypothetical protein
MGGAVVVNAVPRLLAAKYRVSGVAVLDVVEGTALDALPHMPAILSSRPVGFDSVSDAIEWQYVLFISQAPHSFMHDACIASLRTKSATSLLLECRYPRLSFPHPNPDRVARVRLPGVRHCAPRDHTGKVCFSPFVPHMTLTPICPPRLVQRSVGSFPCCTHRASPGACRY